MALRAATLAQWAWPKQGVCDAGGPGLGWSEARCVRADNRWRPAVHRLALEHLPERINA